MQIPCHERPGLHFGVTKRQMINLSNKAALVYDLSGSYTFIAEQLVNDFGRVFYHSIWESGFSQVQDFLPGVGIEGVERVVDPFDYLDKSDLIIFPDVGLDGLQQFLRERGFLVWGSARAGELERNRCLLKEKLESEGMDVADYEIIKGLPALRKYLADPKNANQWVKVCYFRGLTETHEHVAGFASEGWCDDVAVKLGPFQRDMIFLVERAIEGDAVEPGVDIYAVEGEIPQECMWGYENKDCGLFGFCGGPLPKRLAAATEKFLPVLREYDYRGPLSLEFRVTSDGEYLIDVTARFPSPPSEAQMLNTKNIAEIMYQGARGILVEPEYRYQYVAQFVMKSDVLESHPLGVQYPDTWEDKSAMGGVLVHGLCVIDGKRYAVSPHEIEEFAGAVGLGDSFATACEAARDVAESVEGDKVSFSKDALSQIMDTIEQGKELGLDG